MTSPSPRRRPPERAARGPGESDPAAPDRGRAPNAFRGVITAGAVLVVAVVLIAIATSTVDELPWGAIIGVVVVMALALVAGRRRGRAMRAEDDS